MISYDDALARVLAAVPGPLPAEEVPLTRAVGRAFAVDVFADVDLPPFDNSAVDGFAVRMEDAGGASGTAPVTLRITQTIAAGHAPSASVRPGEAARILTGAPVPEGADAVVMVEDTRADGDRVTLLAPPSPRFIRRTGSDIAWGQKALEAGAPVDAGAVGLLAALNRTTARCPRRAVVALLTTGDELVPPGWGSLQPGQIRDANGPALMAAVDEAGGVTLVRRHVPDSMEAVRDALEAAASLADVVVTTGGVSVGEYDHVKAAVEERGRLDFWRIAIKPGKPLAFGRIGEALFFGLPGNPVSSLVTFELFVRPVLRKMGGYRDVSRRRATAVLTHPLPHEPGRREFVRARLSDGPDGALQATPLGAQTSHRLASVAGADALLIADENRGDYAAGEWLSTIFL